MGMYVLWCLIVVSYFLNTIVGSFVEAQMRRMANFAIRHHQDQADYKQRLAQLSLATGMFTGSLLFGTVFFATYENCSCSYGLTLREKCRDTSFEECTMSQGYVKTFLEAFYMSVITVTTVGFGDFTPVTKLGRVIGALWMIMGVL